MAVRLHVQNFQSIADADITVEHFTVVTGSNNSGKTALQRAIRGVFQNTKGTAFIRHGTTKCSVFVDFGKDGSVLWTKGTSKRERPTYIINGGKPIFPGASVPDEVSAFGVASIQCGGAEVWPTIAPQFTGQVFLLDRPGSVLAEAVADVGRVTQLNGALRKSESEKRRIAASLKVRREDLTLYEMHLAEFDGLDEVLGSIDALEIKQGKVARIYKAIGTLTAMRTVLRDAERQVGYLAPVAKLSLPLNDADLSAMVGGLTVMVDLRDRWEQASKQVAYLTPVKDILLPGDDAKISVMLNEITSMGTLRDRWEQASQQVIYLTPVKDLALPLDDAKISLLLGEISEVSSLRDRWEAADAAVSHYSGIEDIDVGAVDADPVERIMRAFVVLDDFKLRLSNAKSSVEEEQRLLVVAKQDQEIIVIKAGELLEEYGECPVCGNSTGDHSC